LDFSNFFPVESTALLQTDWFEPEFGYIVLSFDVDMERLILVAGIVEKPIRAAAKDGWHQCSLDDFSL